MKKISLLFLVLLLAVSLAGGSVLAADSNNHRWRLESTLDELQGAPVKNQQGERLGTVRDFIIDSEGRVSLAVIALGAPSWAVYPQGGEWLWTLGVGDKTVAVPFTALNLEAPNRALVEASRDQLQSAPPYRADSLPDTRWAESVYRYFGQQPYWTE